MTIQLLKFELQELLIILSQIESRQAANVFYWGRVLSTVQVSVSIVYLYPYSAIRYTCVNVSVATIAKLLTGAGSALSGTKEWLSLKQFCYEVMIMIPSGSESASKGPLNGSLVSKIHQPL